MFKKFCAIFFLYITTSVICANDDANHFVCSDYYESYEPQSYVEFNVHVASDKQVFKSLSNRSNFAVLNARVALMIQQVQAESYCYAQQGLREINQSEAQLVATRCRVFNYTQPLTITSNNGRQYLPLSSAPSSLPNNFYDTFEPRDFFEKNWPCYIKKKDYESDLHKKLHRRYGDDDIPHEDAAPYQRAEMRRWSQYRYDGFREFIKSLPVYEDYMLEIAAQLDCDSEFAQCVQQVEPYACQVITCEALEINKKRARIQERKQQELQNYYNEQRKEFSRENFNNQRTVLDLTALEWQQSKPQRVAAYHATLENNGHQETTWYMLSSQACQVLQNHSYNPHNYMQVYGNALQHALMEEIIDGVETASMNPITPLSSNFDALMYKKTMSFFEAARRTNVMGDCYGASKLIDLATTIVDYCSAIVEGLSEGIVQGAVDAVTGTYHMIRHPVQTMKALGAVAVQCAKLMYEYFPLQEPIWLYRTEQEQKRYLEHHERVLQNWRTADKHLQVWWDTTPTRDKITMVTQGVSHNITNIIVGNQCIHLVAELGKVAVLEAAALCRKTKEKVGAVVGVPMEFPNTLFNEMSEVERIAQAPATTLLHETHVYTKLLELGKKFGLSSEQLSQAIMQLEQEGGCAARFYEATEKLKNVPGIEKNIEIILTTEKTSSIRGAFFELEAGLQALERGEEVVNISLKIIGSAGKQELG